MEPICKNTNCEPQDMTIDKNLKIRKGLWKNKKIWKQRSYDTIRMAL